jgi:hypothetical protein
MDKKLKEVSLKEYLMWYEKLVKHKPNETKIEEFESEIQNWNLYDITYYHTDETGFVKFVRYYGIPTPYLQMLLQRNFKPSNDFSNVGISKLKVIPHDSPISNNIEFERGLHSQIMNLYEFGVLSKN